MCLVTRQKKAKILKKDLIAYKMLREKDGEIESLCFTKEWEIGEVEKENFTYVENRYHYSFNDNETFGKYYKLSATICIAQGLHAALSPERLLSFSDDDRDHIFKVKIPTGSKVFYDCTGLLVSDTMIILNKNS